MKLRNFLAMMAVAFFAAGMVSCSDDDDDDNVNPAEAIANKVKGSYNGKMAMAVGDSKMPEVDATVIVTPDSKGKFSITLPEMKMAMGPNVKVVPAMKFDNIEITEVAENKYAFEIGAFEQLVDGTNYKSKGVKATIEGNIIKLTFDVTPGAMPMAIMVTFIGDKSKEAKPAPSLAEKVKGSYNGKMVMAVGDSKMPEVDATVIVTPDSKGKFSITLPEMKMAMGPNVKVVPAMKFDDIEITEVAENKYAFEIGAFEQLVDETNYKSKGVKATIEGNVMTLSFDVTPGAMPMAIMVTFTGNK